MYLYATSINANDLTDFVMYFVCIRNVMYPVVVKAMIILNVQNHYLI